MPTYEYECNTCHHRAEKIFSIMEYDRENLVDAPCDQNVPGETPAGTPVACPGMYEYVLDGARPGHSFKGGGWTPKFHHTANQG